MTLLQDFTRGPHGYIILVHIGMVPQLAPLEIVSLCFSLAAMIADMLLVAHFTPGYCLAVSTFSSAVMELCLWLSSAGMVVRDEG